MGEIDEKHEFAEAFAADAAHASGKGFGDPKQELPHFKQEFRGKFGENPSERLVKVFIETFDEVNEGGNPNIEHEIDFDHSEHAKEHGPRGPKHYESKRNTMNRSQEFRRRLEEDTQAESRETHTSGSASPTIEEHRQKLSRYKRLDEDAAGTEETKADDKDSARWLLDQVHDGDKVILKRGGDTEEHTVQSVHTGAGGEAQTVTFKDGEEFDIDSDQFDWVKAFESKTVPGNVISE